MEVDPIYLYAPGLNFMQSMLTPDPCSDRVVTLEPGRDEYGHRYVFRFNRTNFCGKVYGEDEDDAHYEALILVIKQGYSVWWSEAFIVSQDWIAETYKLQPKHGESAVRKAAANVVAEWDARTIKRRLSDLAFMMGRASNG